MTSPPQRTSRKAVPCRDRASSAPRCACRATERAERAAAHRQAACPRRHRLAARDRADDRRGPDRAQRREAHHARDACSTTLDGRHRRRQAGRARRGDAAVPLLQAAGAHRRARSEGPPDHLRPAAAGLAAADAGRPARLHDRGAAAAHQRRRVEAAAGAAQRPASCAPTAPAPIGDVTQDQLEELTEGIEIEGMRYGSINANLERRTGATAGSR